MPRKQKIKTETDPRTVRRLERAVALKCSFCPPNKGCNSKRKKRGHTKKPKSKLRRLR